MNERDYAEIQQALTALGPICHDLRRRGYDATINLQDRVDHYTVEIWVRVPPLGIPVESVQEQGCLSPA